MRSLVAWLLLSTAAIAAPGPVTRPAYPVPEGSPPGWYAHIDTSMGRILVLLLDKQNPQAVAHFAALANGKLGWDDPLTGERLQQPYYDNAKVTRAKGGLMFEVGDKTGAGGYAPAMFVPHENDEPIDFNLGGRMALKMLGGGQISATRFFITASAQPFLSGHHACIGVVLEGQHRVFDITAVKTRRTGDPIEPVVIETLRVFPYGSPDPLPEPIPYFPPPAKHKLELKEDRGQPGTR